MYIFFFFQLSSKQISSKLKGQSVWQHTSTPYEPTRQQLGDEDTLPNGLMYHNNKEKLILLGARPEHKGRYFCSNVKSEKELVSIHDVTGKSSGTDVIDPCRILGELRQFAIRSHFSTRKQTGEHGVPDYCAHWVVLHWLETTWRPSTTWPKKKLVPPFRNSLNTQVWIDLYHASPILVLFLVSNNNY